MNRATRDAWLTEVVTSLGDQPTWVDYAEVLYRIRTEGPEQGRSAKWKGQFAWFESALNQHASIDWIVLQGTVYLTHVL